ncbi:hypothetical protein BDW22DRAFT_1418640 [Trametopsis cervina]|nr:hypothetical protein BDW22DRAFT_1418640 [Trametopsis cervina]
MAEAIISLASEILSYSFTILEPDSEHAISILDSFTLAAEGKTELSQKGVEELNLQATVQGIANTDESQAEVSAEETDDTIAFYSAGPDNGGNATLPDTYLIAKADKGDEEKGELEINLEHNRTLLPPDALAIYASADTAAIQALQDRTNTSMSALGELIERDGARAFIAVKSPEGTSLALASTDTAVMWIHVEENLKDKDIKVRRVVHVGSYSTATGVTISTTYTVAYWTSVIVGSILGSIAASIVGSAIRRGAVGLSVRVFEGLLRRRVPISWASRFARPFRIITRFPRASGFIGGGLVGIAVTLLIMALPGFLWRNYSVDLVIRNFDKNNAWTVRKMHADNAKVIDENFRPTTALKMITPNEVFKPTGFAPQIAAEAGIDELTYGFCNVKETLQGHGLALWVSLDGQDLGFGIKYLLRRFGSDTLDLEAEVTDGTLQTFYERGYNGKHTIEVKKDGKVIAVVKASLAPDAKRERGYTINVAIGGQ